ncbi:chemotaxis protein CheB [Marinobacterium sedimentorum]|uniref:chemotaxis protein CheB n=1 Tax=Marinobacterium sedimentorum TaxID=2927804 RepID=UPI0020C63C12|nr:chemotaxis protein CheB [Marinobacterium sedimentorum]MCP8686433.1 chemotaxis protein CheB [Marinobacterium sedimentorum]
MDSTQKFELVVIGTSAGGLQALKRLLAELPGDLSFPILIVQHISPRSDGNWVSILNAQCALEIKEADEKEAIVPGKVYLAPANYHLLVEEDRSCTLTLDESVNYARPSIDVLFETAAQSCGAGLIGIVMTGANSDGARGLQSIKNNGGLTIVQDPETAESSTMPLAAIRLAEPDYVLPIDEIRELLISLHWVQRTRGSK